VSGCLRYAGLAYIEIAASLLTRHGYEGETAWFYHRLPATSTIGATSTRA
jgi:hypothetical protein